MDITQLKDALDIPTDSDVSIAVKVLNVSDVASYLTKDRIERTFFSATVGDETATAAVRVYIIKLIPLFTVGNSLLLQNILRKHGEVDFWLVSTSAAISWAPVNVPVSVQVASTQRHSNNASSPAKLKDALAYNTTSHIYGKVVQTSPTKYKKDGQLPIKFLGIKDEQDGPSVKLALFGDDALRSYAVGEVVDVSEAYKWKETSTLSTMKSTKVQFLPKDTLPFEVSNSDELNDPDFLDDSNSAEIESFIIKGVEYSHVYKCCPKASCRNKKLDTSNKCPSCKEETTDEHTYYMASLVLQRQSKIYETKTLFKSELQKLFTDSPDLEFQNDAELKDFIITKLPINAHGIFSKLNGNLSISTAKRTADS